MYCKNKNMKASTRKKMYDKNKAAKCGEQLNCPVCNSVFVKKQWQQAFCCGKCKDKFWNARGDRHADPNYHTKYNQKHPERYLNLLGRGATRAEREYNEALYTLATDKDFRDYVNDSVDNFSGDWDSHDVGCGGGIDIVQEYENYMQNEIDLSSLDFE